MKCIYAILDSSQKLDPVFEGMAGSFVYNVVYKDISAAVSDSDIDKSSLEVGPECALVYERIIEGLMAKHTLLPMRFGTLVKEDNEIIGILEKHYNEFISNLGQVRGKREYGLKVLFNIEDTGFKPNDARGSEQLQGVSPYKKYLLGKLMEHKIEEVMMNKIDAIIEKINNSLGELSFLSKFKKRVTRKIILDGVYLVERGEKDIFIRKVKELKESYQNLKFLLTGPWPPYNFILPLSGEDSYVKNGSMN